MFPVHSNGKHFYNPPPQKGVAGWRAFLRWKLTTRPTASPDFVPDVVQSVPPSHVDGSRLHITLVNHSTVLIQQPGSNVITDPIFSDRTSPFTWAGPKRRRSVGVAWESLPKIDIVLISHNHYDHLDISTLRRLALRDKPTFIVPLGVASLLLSESIGPVHEMDWGDTHLLGSTKVHCVPAMHFSSRGIFDRNKTLWCGYWIEHFGRRVYFAGDTGFSEHFSQIRAEFGVPHVALLPIGAYEPRWFMSPIHMDPEQAVSAHEILGAEVSIAIHHGTFQLADDGLDEPRKILSSLPVKNPFLILNNGEFKEWQ